jgi:hypothetical protein
MTKGWQYKVVKSQRGMDGKWFSYPAAATFAGEAEARLYAADFAANQQTGTRILVISRRRFEGPIGPTNSVAEYRA